ncbi:MAG: 50S ribosomal protein L6 [Candidatus Cloacimonetes bacterium]|nr:50S ribosomal protein L6 [Candidatus Cloacimonadota bacterium]MBS3766929.1 50S ribosomal protein L6 [Candidatus Cloacimonadota bacterium]
MSRVGYAPIEIPDNVDVKISGKDLKIKGSKGELKHHLNEGITAKVKDNVIIFDRKNDEKKYKSLHGLNRSIVSNMVKGVSEGYMKKLMVVGTGYKVEIKGSWLILSLGLSHDIYFEIPEIMEVKTEKIGRTAEGNIPELQAIIDLISPDKEMLGLVAASIRDLKPPGTYNKAKGIRYADEHIRKKPGKVAGGAETA